LSISSWPDFVVKDYFEKGHQTEGRKKKKRGHQVSENLNLNPSSATCSCESLNTYNVPDIVSSISNTTENMKDKSLLSGSYILMQKTGTKQVTRTVSGSQCLWEADF
jgi:hypothetical protein